MPPSPDIRAIGPDHQLSAHRQTGIGPTVGIVIIIFAMIFGAFYFWGAHLNRQAELKQQLPLIQGSSNS